MNVKHAISAIVIVALAGIPGAVAAQSAKVKSETKVEVKDGKDVTVTGCVVSNPDPTGAAQYQLTRVATSTGTMHSYMLVGKDGDLAKHVGHMVEVKGKAADHKDGKVKIETKTKVDREDAPDSKTESKSELKGDLIDLPLLGVKDVKMIRPTCD